LTKYKWDDRWGVRIRKKNKNKKKEKRGLLWERGKCNLEGEGGGE
jgi:hypothetical protein